MSTQPAPRWDAAWREHTWQALGQPWDVLVVGGGITGAGVLREAVRVGMRALLVERRDFAWGTSSRSSKLVHGGLRYLAQGQVRLLRASVRERERLLQHVPGLVEPLGFLFATYRGDHPGRLAMHVGLAAYDLFAHRWLHRRHPRPDFEMLAPHIAQHRLDGGFGYYDAQTDDARLVLRLLREAAADGAVALNQVAAGGPVHEDGALAGLLLFDRLSGRSRVARARVVVNATGVWADGLRGQVGAPPRLRAQRGSHLVFPSGRLPVPQAVSFLHPHDRRPVFVFPWQGVTLVGTTDLDHDRPLGREPAIGAEEVAYLMAAVESRFPALGLTLDDVLASFAGVRPVIDGGRDEPGQESREHAVWEENGLLTVTGGKLTTFRLMALDALRAARRRRPELPEPTSDALVFRPAPAAHPLLDALPPPVRTRLAGRYGAEAALVAEAAAPGELQPVPGTETLWAELRWAARAEAVVHLDDLLLRRTRLGLLLRGHGLGAAQAERVRALCRQELGWDDARWAEEAAAYRELCRRCYGLPPRETIPHWRAPCTETAPGEHRASPTLA